MHLLLHPFTRERKKRKKNENAKKRKRKKMQKKKKNENAKKRKKTKTHIFKNEDAYFQERRRKKTQILGERCQLSSGEYCIRCQVQ